MKLRKKRPAASVEYIAWKRDAENGSTATCFDGLHLTITRTNYPPGWCWSITTHLLVELMPTSDKPTPLHVVGCAYGDAKSEADAKERARRAVIAFRLGYELLRAEVPKP